MTCKPDGTHFACDCQIKLLAILSLENVNLKRRIETLEMAEAQCANENRNVHAENIKKDRRILALLKNNHNPHARRRKLWNAHRD